MKQNGKSSKNRCFAAAKNGGISIKHLGETTKMPKKKMKKSNPDKGQHNELLASLPPVIQRIINLHWEELEQELEKEKLTDLLECFGSGCSAPEIIECYGDPKLLEIK